jgi:hypothetical protein
LFEYLGTLEKSSQTGHKRESKEKDWTKEDQRQAYLPTLLPHVDELKKLSAILSA